MPIYEYRCSSCGHQQEFLQKVSDPLLSDCTACGKATFTKMLTAAGFQLKGSGWYATDFKSKPSSSPSSSTSSGDSKTESKGETKGDPPAEGSKSASSGHACGSGACSACS